MKFELPNHMRIVNGFSFILLIRVNTGKYKKYYNYAYRNESLHPHPVEKMHTCIFYRNTVKQGSELLLYI